MPNHNKKIAELNTRISVDTALSELAKADVKYFWRRRGIFRVQSERVPVDKQLLKADKDLIKNIKAKLENLKIKEANLYDNQGKLLSDTELDKMISQRKSSVSDVMLEILKLRSRPLVLFYLPAAAACYEDTPKRLEKPQPKPKNTFATLTTKMQAEGLPVAANKDEVKVQAAPETNTEKKAEEIAVNETQSETVTNSASMRI